MVMFDRRLEIFLNVADRRSIKQTAEEMFISQPAVSKAVRSLEEELDVILFTRDRTHGLTLTEAGKEIYRCARIMSECDSRIRETAQSFRIGETGTLRLGSLPILSTALLPAVLSEYRRRFPNIVIEMHEDTPRGLRDALLNHVIEVALTCSPFDDFEHRTIINDRLVAVFGPDTEQLPDHIVLSDHPERFMTVNAAIETIEDILRHSFGHTSGDLIRFDSPETLVRMVGSNIGIGLMSEFTLRSIDASFRYCPIRPEIQFELGLGALSFDSLSPAASLFADVLADVMRRDTGC